MIEKLTKEQEAAIPAFVEQALKPLLTGAPTNKEQATTAIESLYEFCNLEKPMVFFVSSPLAAQFAAHLVKSSISIGGDQVRGHVRDQVGAQVRDQVRNQVRNQVWDQVWDQVRNQVRNQVGNQVWDQVRNQVWDQVWNQVGWQFEPFGVYGSFCADAYWLSLFRFFDEQGLVRLSNTQFHNLITLCDSNVYDSIQLNGAYICCEMPTRLERDEEQRLHSTTGQAIEWSDGWGFHALWGVRFPAQLWASVVNKTIAPADVLKLDNIEQRMAAMRFLGLDYIFDALPTKVLHKSNRGNTLFSIDGVTDETEYALRYLCPSTQRQYVSFVPPEIGSEKDADLAMAWKHNMTKEMYQMMELES